MGKEVKDIQQLINNKADSKLEKQIRDIYNYLSEGENYKLLDDILINAGTSEKPKMVRPYSIFSGDGFKDKIIENNRDRYRAAEAADFLAKVESIRDDVDNLLSKQSY